MVIPQKITQAFLVNIAAAGEAVAVVIKAQGSGLGTFVVQGRSNKAFSFQFSRRHGGHVLRFPASQWHRFARELFDYNASISLVPIIECWDATRSLADISLAPVDSVALEVEPEGSAPETDPAPVGIGLAAVVASGEPIQTPIPETPNVPENESPPGDEPIQDPQAPPGGIAPRFALFGDVILDGETEVATLKDGKIRMKPGFAELREEVQTAFGL